MGLSQKTLRHGDHGPAVEALQQALAAAGHSPGAVDGIFGPGTERALRQYQQAHDLVADGIAGPRTCASLGGADAPQALRQSDLARAADELQIELAAMLAVTEIEARGSGFNGSLPVVLFERHIMRRQLEEHGADAAGLAQKWPMLVNETPGGYRGGTQENVRLAAARHLHNLAGAESASYGLFQIMGFHATRLGWRDAAHFARDMARSEEHQLRAFVRFIQADEALAHALRHRNWTRFAARYNGPAYAQNDYDHKLAAAYRRHRRALTE